jgi:tRNA-dihydrouridine synthase
MRRHYASYLKGLPNVKEYRMKLVNSDNMEELLEILNDLKEAQLQLI